MILSYNFLIDWKKVQREDMMNSKKKKAIKQAFAASYRNLWGVADFLEDESKELAESDPTLSSAEKLVAERLRQVLLTSEPA